MMKFSFHLLLFVLVYSCISVIPVIGSEPLKAVPFQEVTLTDSFWLPRLKTQKQVLVPYAFTKTQPAVDNLRKTANFLKGLPDELPFPHRYIASDLYKVMEGAAYLLAIERDSVLERKMDQIIDIIADAQQKDGYLYEAHITGVSKNADWWGGAGMGDKPYSWVVHSHELYDMGHLYEGAVAYYQATGKDKWLKVAEKSARHINHVFFEGDPNYNGGKPVNQAPGHEEIELALVKLYRITGDTLYLSMAKRFIDIRGVTYRPNGEGVMAPEYAQQHLPVRQQTKAVGHAVRATYLYSGMADVSALTGDQTLRPALDSIWHNIVDTRMHITGGLGAVKGIEGFGPEYLLPNKDTYNETCAAVGNVLFNYRMYLLEKNGKYMDVAEVALFNNVLAGVNLKGNKFFYVNPLEADGYTQFNQGQRGRSPWFETACCPTNLARLIPQVSGMMYAYTDDEIYCSLYASNKVCIPLKNGKVKIVQKTGYPFNENINIIIDSLTKNQIFTLQMRIPEWTKSQFVPGKLYQYIDKVHKEWEVSLNGKKLHPPIKDGFISIRRKWINGDRVTLHFPMPLHYSHAIDKVEADRGRVCLTRGPLVYCAEAADNNFSVLQSYIDTLSENYKVNTIKSGMMKGIDFISIPAKAVDKGSGSKNVEMMLLPYYAWDNRSDSTMIVWIPYRNLDNPVHSFKTVGEMSYTGDYRSGNMNYSNNCDPLIVKPYMELPLGAIKPKGWLEDQLIRMKNGMTGHLAELYPQVMGPRNGWLGGDGDVWERGPYWIDGLLPLAYILNDKELKEKVQPWIEKTIESQKPSGYFGPTIDREPESGLQRNNAHDWWPKMVMLKVMQQYYNATGDQRVIKFLTNYFKYQFAELPKTPLDHWTYWGKQRGGDNLMVVYWLYNITNDKFLLELGDLIHKQTNNWTDIFLGGEIIPELFSLHCVNLAQGFKEPVIYYQKNHDQRQIDAVKKAIKDIRKSIGWPIGLYGGDELLHSGNPTQGSELCTAVEMMFSLERILEITGDVQWADQLEKVCYNALPTQITDNFDARQYYQQLNQIRISRTDRNFVTGYNGTDQVFGLLTGYPCCTSNLHQGWPKFTQNLWYATEDNGAGALVYAPNEVRLKVANGIVVQWDEETNYPFDEMITFKLMIPDKKQKNVVFPLHLRIPAWCEGANIQVNGVDWSNPSCNSIAKVIREWKSGDIVTLQLPMHVKISRWYEQSAVVERGPIIYALCIGEKWEKIQDDRKFGDRYGDWYYEVHPTSPWNYCLPENSLKPENIEKGFLVLKHDINGKYPWNIENAPIEIKTKGKRMDQWNEYNGSAGPLPYSVQYQIATEPEEEITLIPYGCTTLRITEFPVTSK